MVKGLGFGHDKRQNSYVLFVFKRQHRNSGVDALINSGRGEMSSC